jgi:hypothetical protein
MPRKKTTYRKINYRASRTRVTSSIVIHPDLLYGLQQVAKQEHKSVAWLVELALSDYFGVEIMLQKFKTKPREEYTPRR